MLSLPRDEDVDSNAKADLQAATPSRRCCTGWEGRGDGDSGALMDATCECFGAAANPANRHMVEWEIRAAPLEGRGVFVCGHGRTVG